MQHNVGFQSRLKNAVIDLQKYKYITEQIGLKADHIYSIGTDIVEEVDKMIPELKMKYPRAIFIGGQLIFGGNSELSRLLHNYAIFAIQRKLYKVPLTLLWNLMQISRDDFVIVLIFSHDNRIY